MPEIEQNGERIEVEIVDSESHRGVEVVQVESADDNTTLSDKSGNAPWVEHDELITGEGLQQTPESAVALADGRTPEEAEAVREEVESNE
jgi:hypothetical protein